MLCKEEEGIETRIVVYLEEEMTYRMIYIVTSIAFLCACFNVLFVAEASAAENILLILFTIAGFLMAIYHKMPEKD